MARVGSDRRSHRVRHGHVGEKPKCTGCGVVLLSALERAMGKCVVCQWKAKR